MKLSTSAALSKWNGGILIGVIRIFQAIPRHHLHHQDQTEDPLLLFQLDSALSPHLLHGCSRLHPSSRLWRETVVRFGNFHFINLWN